MRGVLVALTGLLSLVLVLAALLVGAAAYVNSPPPGDGDEAAVAFTIAKGENLGSVARRLEERGLIRSAFFLVQYGRLRRTDTLFQAGSYLVPRGLSALRVHDFFITGSQLLHRVTIPEGWTSSRIASFLEEKGITPAEGFLAAAADPELLARHRIPGKNAEGFLFPDTYHFPENFPPRKTVEILIENFFRKLGEIESGYASLGPGEIYDAVILASIVEREYRDPREAPLMASVFRNRLKVNMALGSCATVEYIISEIQKKPHPEYLTYRDLEIPSPYNTYRNPGLPPGPISNPGRTALDAAFHPADTDYLVFRSP